MTLQSRLGNVLDRIAYMTGALRARRVEAARVEFNGGPTPEFHGRIEALIDQLEQSATELRRKLA